MFGRQRTVSMTAWSYLPHGTVTRVDSHGSCLAVSCLFLCNLWNLRMMFLFAVEQVQDGGAEFLWFDGFGEVQLIAGSQRAVAIFDSRIAS